MSCGCAWEVITSHYDSKSNEVLCNELGLRWDESTQPSTVRTIVAPSSLSILTGRMTFSDPARTNLGDVRGNRRCISVNSFRARTIDARAASSALLQIARMDPREALGTKNLLRMDWQYGSSLRVLELFSSPSRTQDGVPRLLRVHVRK